MLLRMTWDQASGVSADRVNWTWGLAGPGADSGETAALASIVLQSILAPQATTLTLASMLAGGMKSLFFESFPNAGGEATGMAATDAEPAITGSARGPSEIAVVVSRVVSTPRGPSPRGRLYVGPLSSTRIASERPSGDVRNTIGQWAAGLHEDFEAAGRVPVLVRDQGKVTANEDPILAYRVDDAWDTQRRRGVDPTVYGEFVPA